MLLLLRLISTGLAGRYPAFLVWIASTVGGNVLLAFTSSPAVYRDAWIATQAIALLALFFALLELVGRILEHYPGLRRRSASTLFGVLAAAAIVAAAAESTAKPMRMFTRLHSGWTAAAGVYVLLLVALATYLDPRRRRNVIIHERVFLGHCLVSVVVLALPFTNPELSHVAQLAGVIGGVVFPLGWMLMNMGGEVDKRPQPTERTVVSTAETEATIDRLERLVTRSSG